MKTLFLGVALSLFSLPLLAAPGHEFAFGKPAPAGTATRTVEVVLGDMYFEPGSLTVRAGETVRFVVSNKGQVSHEFNLGDAVMHARHQQDMLAMQAPMDHSAMGHGQGAHGGMRHDDPNMVMVAPGKQGELTWTFSQPGVLEFACNVPGHYQAGMVGKLTIAQ